MSDSTANSDPDGAMGAGAADAPDLATPDGGDATGGGHPGNPDDMGAENGATIDELTGEKNPDAGVDDHLDGPDIQHPTNWRIT